MIIIGSTALGTRVPKDLDLIGTIDEFNLFIEMNKDLITNIKEHDIHYSFKLNGTWVEFEIAKPGNSAYDYLTIMDAHNKIMNIPNASKEVLFSIKKSHIHFPIHFYKNVFDYIFLKSIVGEDKYPEVTKKRFKETEERLGKLKTPKLSKKSKEFFNQSSKFVKSYFVHDNIHKIMSHLEKPMYEYMQPDPESAFCSKDMWNTFPEQWRDWCVMEEAYVIALERKVLPALFENRICDAEEAFKWALMRISTTLCSGFFREWATDRFLKIMSDYNKDYHLKFMDAIDNGLIEYTKDNKNFIEV